jgi:hypothetical protein
LSEEEVRNLRANAPDYVRRGADYKSRLKKLV